MSILDDGYHFPAPTIGTAPRPVQALTGRIVGAQLVEK